MGVSTMHGLRDRVRQAVHDARPRLRRFLLYTSAFSGLSHCLSRGGPGGEAEAEAEARLQDGPVHEDVGEGVGGVEVVVDAGEDAGGLGGEGGEHGGEHADEDVDEDEVVPERAA